MPDDVPPAPKTLEYRAQDNVQSMWASNSLTYGIFSVVLGLVVCLGIPLGLAAIASGLWARREISRQPSLGGSRKAAMGIILGSVGVLLGITCGFAFSNSLGTAHRLARTAATRAASTMPGSVPSTAP